MSERLDAIRRRVDAATEDMAAYNAQSEARALLAEIDRLLDIEVAAKEAHAVLDAAGIPSAERAVCNDPNCKTKLGHRVRALMAQKAHWQQTAAQALAEVERLRAEVEARKAEW